MNEFDRPSREAVFYVLSGEDSSADGFDGDYREWVRENADPGMLNSIKCELDLVAQGKAPPGNELYKETRIRLSKEGKI